MPKLELTAPWQKLFKRIMGEHETPAEAAAQYDGTTPLDTPEAAAMIGIEPSTLEIWRCKGKGPKHFNAGRAVRYRKRDVEAWIEDNMAEETLAVG